LIERAILLWSNRGDTILAVMGMAPRPRRYQNRPAVIGCELKESYYRRL